MAARRPNLDQLTRFEALRDAIDLEVSRLRKKRQKTKDYEFHFDGASIPTLREVVDMAIEQIKNPYGNAPVEPFHAEIPEN